MKIFIFRLVFLGGLVLLLSNCKKDTNTEDNSLDPSWSVVGQRNFASIGVGSIKMAISPSGEPYVVFSDATYDKRISVMKFDGNQWDYVGTPGLSKTWDNSFDIDFSPSGEPFIVFGNGQSAPRPSVMKFNGTDWAFVGIQEFSQDEAWEISFAVNSTGEPYVAFCVDCYWGWEHNLSVMKFDGNEWAYVGAQGAFNGGSISIAINQSGEPFVLINGVSVKKFNGSNWVSVGYLAIDEAWELSLITISQSGVPYIFYKDSSYKQSVMKFEGNKWVYVGKEGFTPEGTYGNDLKISLSDEPYVAYLSDNESNQHRASVMKFDEIGWNYVGAPFFSPEIDFFKISLALNPIGIPYVAFKETSSKKGTVLKFIGP